MTIKVAHNKTEIFNFLKRNIGFQLYLIGDLDEFFWSKTIWFTIEDNDEIKSIALLYVATETPTLLLFHNDESYFSSQLLSQIKHYLPSRFNAHLSIGLIDIFGQQNVVDYYGLHYKMILTKTVSAPDDPNIKRLSTKDLSDINDLFSISYPNNWFDSRMLETGKYYGYFINGQLAGVSGVHVYSEEYSVAALGNIATHPDFRGQQIGYKLTSALCHDLRKTVDVIGLNVRADNDYAIRCYKKIGFEIIGSYDECLVEIDRVRISHS